MPITSTKRAYAAGKYECKTCGAAFSSKAKRDAHVKKTHGGKTGMKMMKTV